MTEKIRAEYDRWCALATDLDIKAELEFIDKNMIEDAFYRDLAFDTGGLRGTIGAANRMNVYVVAKASQGLANYLLSMATTPSVVIGYDSRIKSDVFAKVAAGVFAANGVHVHIWPELLPVPTISFAVRELGCSAGVMITASHNPSKYNGYKVYGPDGCQITTGAAAAILSEIEKIDIFTDVKKMPWESAKIQGLLEPIEDRVLTSFIEEVKNQSVLYGDEINRDHKAGKYALKIHGRHPEDYIVIENIGKLLQVQFAGEQFPLQPDAQRMLDSIYGAFDMNKNEENRHGIIALNSRGVQSN